MKKVGILLLLCTSLFQSSAHAAWYLSKVVEVTSRAQDVEALYIRTELNPNPGNCATTWAGARWKGTGSSVGLAASAALTSKVTGKFVRFYVDDAECDVSGLPVMTWIQLRD